MPNKQKGISRIDQESKGSHGWFGRVAFQKQVKSKFFSDKKHGGSDQALALAISWRDKTEKDLGKVRSNMRIDTVSRAKSNKTKTGVIGVSFNEKCNRYEVT